MTLLLNEGHVNSTHQITKKKKHKRHSPLPTGCGSIAVILGGEHVPLHLLMYGEPLSLDLPSEELAVSEVPLK